MVIEKFPYIFKKFVKSSVALVKRNQIPTWAMWKSDFWSLVQLVISQIFWKCMEIYQWPSLILTHTGINIYYFFLFCSTLYVKLYWHSCQRCGGISFLSTGRWTNLFNTGIRPQSGCPTLPLPPTCQFPISTWVKSRINGPGYLQSLFGKSFTGLCQRNSGAFGLA